MKVLAAILSIFLLFTAAEAQKILVPIVEMKSKGLLGGVENGRWLTAAQVGRRLKKDAEFVLVGWRGVEEGGVTTGNRGETEDVCQDFWRMKMDLETDSGVALGSGAKWNPLPRLPKTIDLKNPAYVKNVSDFLKTKGVAKPIVKITQAYRVDLEGDGQEEVLLAATRYARGEAENPGANDYSFVMLRKIAGGAAQNILIAGDFFAKKTDLPPNAYEISSIADLNGDGRMEIVVFGSYYEGQWAEVFELKGTEIMKVENLSIRCEV